ncbi:MAG: hypothetical protein ACJAYF_003037 [Arenicella sp.]|jgi:hypothetical protein
MKNLYKNSRKSILAMSVASLCSLNAIAKDVNDVAIDQQRAELKVNTKNMGFGPQSPRDIDQAAGTNLRKFGVAPSRTNMNLCNIHFHKNAEHKGGDFTTYAGNGDGMGKDTGYVFDGKLSEAQLKPVAANICDGKNDPLKVGDTIEVHWVYSSAQVNAGATLGACLADSTMNPGLRVEGQVFALANDKNALSFVELAELKSINGYSQAPNIPTNTGSPVNYLGSTTGPAYNEKASPLQVSWSVRPKTAILDINSLGEWCESNVFNEDHAHGVRNLVINPALLSPIK